MFSSVPPTPAPAPASSTPPTTTTTTTTGIPPGSDFNLIGVVDKQDQVQVQQSFRIFKRGDEIPGIEQPPILQQQSQQHQQLINHHNHNNHNNHSANTNHNTSLLVQQLAGLGISQQAQQQQQSSTNTTNNVNNKPNGNSKTATTRLIELAKFNKLQAEFKLINKEGPPHAPIFMVQVQLGSNNYSGSGSSIKKASLAAAEVALASTTLPPPPTLQSHPPQNRRNNNTSTNRSGPPPPRGSRSRAFNPQIHGNNMNKIQEESQGHGQVQAQDKNPISLVHEFCSRGKAGSVEYILIDEQGPPHAKIFKLRCNVNLNGETYWKEAEGSTKQAAKKVVSQLMLDVLTSLPPPSPPSSAQCSTSTVDSGAAPPTATGTSTNINNSRAAGLPRSKRTVAKSKKKLLVQDSTNPSSGITIGGLSTADLSPISRVIHLAHARKYPEPTFELMEEKKASNNNYNNAGGGRAGPGGGPRRTKSEFTFRATAGPFFAMGSGSNKKEAKKSSAMNLLLQLEPGQHTASAPALAQAPVPQPLSQYNCGGKQLAPGIIVFNKNKQQVQAEELVVNNWSPPSSPIPPIGIGCSESSEDTVAMDKLGYLAKLLGAKLSFSDFPKQADYLSILSFSTNPPHVAHGIGPTLTQARNQASLKILEELTSTGIDPMQFN